MTSTTRVTDCLTTRSSSIRYPLVEGAKPSRLRLAPSSKPADNVPGTRKYNDSHLRAHHKISFTFLQDRSLEKSYSSKMGWCCEGEG